MRGPWGVRRACVAALVLSGCTPATTRPSFTPIPEALHAVINARPADVTRDAQELLKADTSSIRFVNLRDAFLETNDFAGTHRASNRSDGLSNKSWIIGFEGFAK